MQRRNALKAMAAAGLGAASGLSIPAAEKSVSGRTTRALGNPFIETGDGTGLFYKDWGKGKPVVFVTGWAVNSDMWEYQMTYLSGRGLRCIAYDRRGHGRSGQTDRGYDYDTLADDLAALIARLDLRGATLVGHSMGGGEIVRYLSRHGAARVSRI